MSHSVLRGGRSQLLIAAAAMIVMVALVDWHVDLNVSFGFLYLFPMLIVGYCLQRWQVAVVALLCTLLAERFAPFAWRPSDGLPRDVFMLASFIGTGLFAFESAKNRRLAATHAREIEQEVELRREAEQQLKVLIESSPAAIITADSTGKILMANLAAHRVLGFDPENLIGRAVHAFIPSLANVPVAEGGTPSFRTAMQCPGRRSDGEVFLADIWFSTYTTKAGPRLAAMLIDSSEDLRSREEVSLHQLLSGSRLVMGAVSHEIRNVCSAISVVYTNLSRNPALPQNEDFRALGALAEGLGKMASLDLKQSMGRQELSSVDVYQLLEELRIVTESALQESGVDVSWEIPEGLPEVWGDRHNLFQVLLNLVKNSERAMRDIPEKHLSLRVSSEAERIVIRVCDSAGGVANPDSLFRPFQEGAEGSGLGLYVSRAFARASSGELRYESSPASCFALDLAPCGKFNGSVLANQTHE
jgi:PAS domain S-box-containing protein